MQTIDKAELIILSEISKISNSPSDLGLKLQRIVEVVAHGMGKEGASVFLIDRDGRSVRLAAAVGLNQESIGRLSFPLGRGVAGWVAEQKVPLALKEPFSDPRFSYVPDSGIGRFKSLAAAPILDEDRCLGVIFVLSTETWDPSQTEITLLTTAANQISGVIQSASLFENIQERLSELATLYEIGMAIASSLDIDQILSVIAKNAIQILQAQGCAIRLLDTPERGIEQKAPSLRQFANDQAKEVDVRIGGLIAKKMASERRPIIYKDISQEQSLGLQGLAPMPVFGVPLIYQDLVVGVITLYGRENGRPFTEDDVQFLTTISGTAAVAIVNASMYERMQALAEEARLRAQELSILYDIATAMSTTLNLDRLLRIILTAATMGGSGLGFNRAILLLTNERTNTLQGMMGVGPANWEEAGRVWNEVASRQKSLLEWIQTGDLFIGQDSEFNTIARGIRVPLDPKGGVLALTALEKRPYNITDAYSDPLVPRDIYETLKAKAFATAPLVAKDRAIGVILVDNLFNQRPITDRDIKFLCMFAHQAALAIENAIIHSNLETMNRDMRAMQEQLVQSEKMAALGTMMAEITHEIRNPLVSIGGFARRLASKIENGEGKKYLDIILSEVARLEGIIHDNLAYIRDITPQTREADINALIADVIELYDEELIQRGIRLEQNLSRELPLVLMDPQQIKQAIINLVTNAIDAMPNGGTLSISTRDSQDAREVVVAIADTGYGISAEAIHNIFNPYYTTKARGTGLGLPIAHRIIRAHKGRIEVRNRESGGAIFIITLPYPARGCTNT